MGNLIIIIIGLIEAIAIAAVLYVKASKGVSEVRDAVVQVESQLEERKTLLSDLQSVVVQLVDFSSIQAKGYHLIELTEALKAERGRNTITNAELETVEGRLRELEEIERELEASGIETKEELKILNKKERDLNNKNEALKEQIAVSMQKVEELMSQIQMSAELQAKVDEMKVELMQTQERVSSLLQQIEAGNEQYFILKKRYDALDIEYAQLFEKFSEAEAALGSKKG
ncbi:MAG: hypothetical protein J5J00_00370 [Deltaproteobacteria bacterium]|nr:hypothetical protein [Deltaproteobacteria bacterium]